MMRAAGALALAVAAIAATGSAVSQTKGAAPPAQTVRIAYLDPLSGPFAAVGQNILKHFQVGDCPDAINWLHREIGFILILAAVNVPPVAHSAHGRPLSMKDQL